MMGLFDNLTCNYPLDKKHIQDDLFQTKSFDCFMEEYEITEGGLLFKTYELGVGWGGVQLDEPEFMRDFTGEVRFCTLRTRNYEHMTKKYFYEYITYFKCGKLKEIDANHENWKR